MFYTCTFNTLNNVKTLIFLLLCTFNNIFYENLQPIKNLQSKFLSVVVNCICLHTFKPVFLLNKRKKVKKKIDVYII